jgi:hypothetical protein
MIACDVLLHMNDLSSVDAERWIASALAEAAALRTLDDHLYPLIDDTTLNGQARHLHAAWQAWLQSAQCLLEKIRSTPPLMRQHLHGMFDLTVEIGFARGLAKMPLEEIQRRAEQVRAGNFTSYSSMEDLRRELGLAPKPRRSA